MMDAPDPRVLLMEALWLDDTAREAMKAIVAEWRARRDEELDRALIALSEIAFLERMWEKYA